VQVDVDQGGHRAEPLGDMLDPEHVAAVGGLRAGAAGRGRGPLAVRFRRAHHALPARRSRASCTLAIMATRIAPPKMIGSGLALIPIGLKPPCRIASMSARRKARMIVPAPPASAVPPMTAPAMA